jgi:hypothetical protein
MRNSARLALFAAVLCSSVALAQEGGGMRRSGFLLDSAPQERSTRLAVFGVLPYGYFGFGSFPIGAGATFYIPLVKDGFIPPVNDEFGIDFGADIIFFLGYNNPFAFWIPVSVLWTFHFTDNFALYAKAGVALRVWPGYVNAVFPDFTTAVGLNFMLSKAFGLRAEVGYPGIKLGVLFNF